MKKILLLLVTFLGLTVYYSCSDKDDVITIPVKSINIDFDNIELCIDSVFQLTTTILPSQATNKTIYWSSSSDEQVSITEEGKIKGLKLGKCRLIAKTINGITDTCHINVRRPEIHVESVEIDIKELSIEVGQTKQLKAGVLPLNADEKTVVWGSEDSDIIRVDENGNLTPIKEGDTRIFASSLDGAKLAYCEVNVKPKYIPVESVAFKVDNGIMAIGEKHSYKFNILPEDALNKKVKWESSNTDIATIDENGEITAIAVGEAEIKVITEDNAKEAVLILTVVKEIVPLEEIVIESEISLHAKDSKKIEVEFVPENATRKEVTYTSEDESIATIDEEGNIEGIAEGNVKIIVSSLDGKITASCNVEVKPEYVSITGVYLDKYSLKLKKGDKGQLKASIHPYNATNRNIKWESSDVKVAVVDENGEVTAVGAGSAKIKVISEDNPEQYSTCYVTVESDEILISSITITGLQENINIGEKLQLDVNIVPAEAVNNNVLWSVDDESIATIDQKGELTAKAEGKVVVTAKGELGGVSTTCTINVVDNSVPVTSIENTSSWTELYVGAEEYITYKIVPEDASNTKLTWTSSNEDIATVSSYGLVKAISEGEVTISAESSNGIKMEANIKIKDVPYKVEPGFRISPELTVAKREKSYEKVIVSVEYFTTADKSKELTWSISDNTKVDFRRDYKGEIETDYSTGFPIIELKEEAKDGDKVVITASREDGKTSTCNVTVRKSEDYKFVKYIFGGSSTLEVAVGEDKELGFYANPEDATNKVLKYFNTDDSILTVSEDGTIHAVKPGTSMVTVYSQDNGKFEQCIITVK